MEGRIRGEEEQRDGGTEESNEGKEGQRESEGTEGWRDRGE
jgi:hypothetical protein